jgi:hypothetical protein
MASYTAHCPKCGWTGGQYASERDRDNAVRLHQSTGCPKKGQ